jgi:hypothetical protein
MCIVGEEDKAHMVLENFFLINKYKKLNVFCGINKGPTYFVF